MSLKTMFHLLPVEQAARLLHRSGKPETCPHEKRPWAAGHSVDPTMRGGVLFKLSRPSGSAAVRPHGWCGRRGRTSQASWGCSFPEAVTAVSTHYRAAVRVARPGTPLRRPGPADRTEARHPRAVHERFRAQENELSLVRSGAGVEPATARVRVWCSFRLS